MASNRPCSQARSTAIAPAIAASFQRRVGRELIAGSRGFIGDAMISSPAVILCHDGGSDPRFIYANKAAAALWRMGVDDIIGMPSRLTAPPEFRAERSRALVQVATDGVLFGYSGERVRADGTRFVIEDATLWTVDLPDGRSGQAVVFETWRESSGPAKTGPIG